MSVKLFATTLTTGERICIEAPFALKETCKELPGARWNRLGKVWTVPATPAGIMAIVDAFAGDNVEMTIEVQELIQHAQRQSAAQKFKRAEDLPDIPVRTSAWAHQRRAFYFARELDAAMLAMAMGSGKSMTAIALLQEWDAKHVLILCPVSVLGVWPNQFELHAIDPAEWHVVAGDPRMSVTGRVESIAQGILFAEKTNRRSVSIINYDSAWRENMAQLIKAQDWDVIIADESHRLKSAGGKASRFASGLRDITARRLCLTGTPMPHSPLDIYAQYRFLDPGIFGTSKNRFMRRYAIMGGFENRQVKDWQNIDELQRKFASIAFIVGKQEALPDLPEQIFLERRFKLGAKGLATYKAMERDFIAAVDEDLIVANNALAKSLRLRQIAAGHSRTDEGAIIHLDDGREKLLEDVLEGIPPDEPVVVFSVFHPDLDAIERVAEKLGRRYGELSGRRRDGLTSDSKMSPAVDLLGVQIKSGALGVDLTRAAYAIYYDPTWELGDYEQSLDRVHRPGQTRTTRYIALIADDTVDETVYQALRDKKDVVQAVIDAARSLQV